MKIKKFVLVVLLAILICGCSNNKLAELPKPEISEGMRG